MAEQTEVTISELDDVGLEEAFYNWLSTTVDTINSNCDTIETALNLLLTAASQPTITLTRCDTAATSNIALSTEFNDFMERVLNEIDALKQRVVERGG